MGLGALAPLAVAHAIRPEELLIFFLLWLGALTIIAWNIKEDLPQRKKRAPTERRFIEPCAEDMHDWQADEDQEVCATCKASRATAQRDE